MSLTKPLIALSLAFALTACTNQDQAENAAEQARDDAARAADAGDH